MADDSSEQGGQSSTGGAQTFNQADIDALLNSASESSAGPSGDESAPAVSPEPSSEESAPAPESSDAQVTQDDVDALLSGASESPAEPSGDESSPAVSPGPSSEESAPAPESSVGPVTQNDIDALLEAAGSDEALAQGDASKDDPVEENRLDTLGRPFDESAAAMQAAIEGERSSAQTVSSADTPAPSPPQTRPHEFPSIEQAAPVQVDPKRVTMLNDVNLSVRLQLGGTRMRLEEILALGEGSVVELDKLAGDPVDVLVNDRLVARGEVLVLNDVFCVRVCEVLSNDPHRITV